MRLLIPIIDKVLPKLITRDQFTMLLEGSATKDRRLERSGFRPPALPPGDKIALRQQPPETYAKARMKPFTPNSGHNKKDRVCARV